MDGEKMEEDIVGQEPEGDAGWSADANTGSVDDKRIPELEEEVRLLKDALLRKAAELDNLRKRMEREKTEAVQYASGKFAKDLLSVLDNFQKVADNFPAISKIVEQDQTLKAFFEGIMLSGRELISVFSRHGLSRIEISRGEAFDPSRHQAMCDVESDEFSPGTVVQVFQDGYLHHSRLLRPVMVAVARRKESKSSSGSSSSSSGGGGGSSQTSRDDDK
ncbi:MAG: nucleotide exchange factor GrpE [Holosporaceae bacterium]|jgi:molecular chaperone GrpE|nr:nucleotide exchange factor GrpE [Holosporaceae bacterium]